MGLKGFYFSFDAIIALLVMATAGSLVVSSLNDPGVESDQIRFSQYGSQATDISNYILRRDAKSLEPEIEVSASHRDIMISSFLILKEKENTDKAEKTARSILSDEKYSTEIYYRSNQTFNLLYPESPYNFNDSSSSKTLTVVDDKVYEILVVVGE